MTESVTEILHTMGPVLAAVWILTFACVLLRPQRFLNSMLLLFALLVTVITAAGFFGHDTGARILLGVFLLGMLSLFLVPVLLIINGVQMIRRESLSAAHLLSLALGVFVGVGEIAAVLYVLGIGGKPLGFADTNEINLWIMLVAFTVFYFSFLVLSFVIYAVFIQILPHRMQFDYVIIHGCGLAGGGRMTKLLSNRVDRAIRIYERCRRKPVIIPSGGQGADETRSEADAMKEYLLAHGIPETDILPEDRSATTMENLRNSKKLIDARPGGKRTALVSSNYHIYRCLRYAEEIGLKCTGVGAPVALYYWPSALIREFIAVFTTRRFLIWSLVGYLLFISPILYAFAR